MKFETLKRKCADYFFSGHTSANIIGAALVKSTVKMIETGKLNNYRETLEAVKNEGYEVIMRTDIRNLKVLINQFPELIPAWIKNGNYYFDLTDNGWEILKPQSD